MSDLAELLKELEQVAKDTNLKEIKEEPVEEIVTSKDDVSSLFEGLEAAYTESKIEEEIKNRLSEEDEQKLNAFSGFMQSVTELTNKPDSNKSIEDLFATIAPPQPQTKTPDVPIVEETIEEVVEEPIEIEQADTIIEQIVSSLDDMNDKTDVQEQVEQISKLRDEFNNFRALVQQQMSSTGSGEVKLEFLDDVQRSTAKVDGKFLKFDSSSGKFVGDEPSVTSLAITALDIDGATDIGANLADADLFIVDDGAGGTNRKSTLARLKTYIGSGSSAADDISAGDAAVNITTSSGNITIDAAANNSDIILKGTDGGSDTTFLTIDGSAAGKATFNDEIVSGAVITSGAGLVIADDGNIGSASDTDAIAIASDGVVTMNQIPVFSAGVNVSGGTIAGTLSTAAQGNITSLGTLTTLTVDNIIINGTNIGHTSDTDSIAIASDGVVTFSQAPVFPDGSINIADLDIDGGTDIGANLADADLIIVDDGAGGTNRKATLARLKTYIGSGATAADDISAGDAAVTITTSSGDITIDAAANNSDIILKGTDGGSDTTFLTIDGSAAGKATFNDEIVSGAVITSGAGLVIADSGNIGSASDTDSIAIASDGVVTFSQAPVFPNGSIDLADLDIDGGTDIGAGLADADLFIVDDGAGGTNRKTAASRIKTYIADVTLTTAAQTNITSLGTLTALTVDNVVINGATIGHTDDTDLMTVADGVLTVAGEVDAVSLDVSGDVDIDGTLEADAITVNGTTLAETISDTVGAMVGSNTETGITVTYQDSDNTIDFAINAAQTTITSILATDLKIGEDDQTKIDFETADEIHFYAANEHQIKLVNGALVPVTDNDIDLGTSSLEFKDAFFDGTVTSDAFAGPLTGDVTGNADTATALATARTIHGVSFDGSANIDLSEVIQDTVGAMLSSNTETGITATYQDSDGTIDLVIATLNQDTTGNAATATALETARTIHGVSFDGSANIDLSEVIEDTVGAMFSSNTETGITATYQDADGTIDLVIATLNQDTTGNAATATALETARTIGGVSFDGSANIDLLATDIKIGEDDQTKIDFETADEIHFYAANAEQVFVSDGVFGPQTDSDVDLGTNSTRFKDAFIDTVTTTGLITSGSNLVIADAGNIGSASDTDAIAIASDGVVTFSQAPVFPDGSINLADLDIDGGTDIGAAIVDADLFIVDDGAGGTNRKTAASRLKTYIQDAGTVLQVVTASNSGSVNTTSTSFADITDVTVNITPASSSNKILVLTNSDGVYNLTIGANVTYTQKVLRDSTSLGERSTTAASGGGGLQSRGSMTLARLDSPSSTSQLTYKVQHKISNSSSTGTAVNTHITLLEIQG